MFDLEIQFDDIRISSIEEDDILNVHSWMIRQDTEEDPGLDNTITLENFKERFLEYFMTENEIFLKIEQNKMLIGVLKGRVELKKTNEVFIWCYIIDNNMRDTGVGTEIINNIINYFKEKLGIYNFLTGVVAESKKTISFWNKNKFRFNRLSENFYDINGKSMDMLVLKRID
jgi:Acetyltransferases, including N-acetylases of ribosomal proteins